MGQIARSHRCAESAIFYWLLRRIRSFGIRISSKQTFTAALLLLILAFPAVSSAYNILFVTGASSVNPREQIRIDLMISWGHTITLVEDSAAQSAYEAAIAISDVAYVSEEVDPSQVSTKLTNACIGVVVEEQAIVDDLGLAITQAVGTYNSTTIYINNGPSHYITQPFTGAGPYAIYTATDSLNFIDLTDPADVAPGLQVHAWGGSPVDSNLAALATVNSGDLLLGGTPALARRVMIPINGGNNFDFNTVTADGRTIMQRSIEWAALNSSCQLMHKRTFLPDGTSLADGAQLSAGTEIKFLIYINNKGNAISDISIQDVLNAPSFSFVNDSLQVDNSQPACVEYVCNATEESTIFTAVSGTPLILNGPTNTDVSYSSGTNTVNVGNQNEGGNSQVDVAANSVYALLFSVTLN